MPHLWKVVLISAQAKNWNLFQCKVESILMFHGYCLKSLSFNKYTSTYTSSDRECCNYVFLLDLLSKNASTKIVVTVKELSKLCLDVTKWLQKSCEKVWVYGAFVCFTVRQTTVNVCIMFSLLTMKQQTVYVCTVVSCFVCWHIVSLWGWRLFLISC